MQDVCDCLQSILADIAVNGDGTRGLEAEGEGDGGSQGVKSVLEDERLVPFLVAHEDTNQTQQQSKGETTQNTTITTTISSSIINGNSSISKAKLLASAQLFERALVNNVKRSAELFNAASITDLVQ